MGIERNNNHQEERRIKRIVLLGPVLLWTILQANQMPRSVLVHQQRLLRRGCLCIDWIRLCRSRRRCLQGDMSMDTYIQDLLIC